jgi:Flp pilus assembly protein TadG
MDEMTTVEMARSVRSQPRFLRSLRSGERSGQAIVEFALVSVAFFMMVFGTIDFGRAVYMYSELSNAVREGARYGKINPADSANIKGMVREKAPTLGGSDSNGALLTVNEPSCTGGCYPGCSDVTVSASYRFTPVTTRFLGVGEITLRASAKVEAE